MYVKFAYRCYGASILFHQFKNAHVIANKNFCDIMKEFCTKPYFTYKIPQGFSLFSLDSFASVVEGESELPMVVSRVARARDEGRRVLEILCSQDAFLHPDDRIAKASIPMT